MKEITAIVKGKELAVVKSLLKVVKERHADFVIKKFKTGTVGDKTLITFRVDDRYFKNVLEKFAFNDIAIMNREKEVIDFIEERKEHKKNKLRNSGWADIKTQKKNVSAEELEVMCKNGEFDKVLKETHATIGSDIEIVKKAKTLLSESICNAIEMIFQEALSHRSKVEESIDKLLRIASNGGLKNAQKRKERIKAGKTAIKICYMFEEYQTELIRIANHNKINNEVNIKAIVKFSGIVKEQKKNMSKEILDSLKLLNTRWIRIAYDSVESKLKKKEINAYNYLLNFVDTIREAA
ncbi:MAG: hypothetical protein V3V16_09615 [Melioribacteraceae bacterium]